MQRRKRNADAPDGGSRRGASEEPPKGLGALFLSWLPPVGAAIFLLQVVFSGLAPALARSRQLDADERGMEARVDAILADRERVEEDRRILRDPIFQERVRRTVRDPRQPDLTLVRARAALEAAAGGASGRDRAPRGE